MCLCVFVGRLCWRVHKPGVICDSLKVVDDVTQMVRPKPMRATGLGVVEQRMPAIAICSPVWGVKFLARRCLEGWGDIMMSNISEHYEEYATELLH